MLLDEARQTIARFNMLQKGDRVLVGVSGGQDSMALLYVLQGLKKELGVELVVAHLDHMIRKNAAEKDALFVKKMSRKLGLPALIESEDVPAMAKFLRLSLEEAARAARYEFYLRSAKKFNANKIALAHTQDDQAETVLMRLIRGAGLLGLSGIPPKRKTDGIMVIRPFIEIPKSDIKDFIKKRKIPFRQDSTNIQTVYLRNRIRHKLIPFLEKEFNPQIKQILYAAGKNLRIDYDYLLKTAEEKFKRYARYTDNSVVIDLRFLDEELAMQRMIVREAIREVKGDLNSITYGHWEDLNCLLKKKAGRYFNLPGKVLVKKTGDELIFYKESPMPDIGLAGACYELALPGKTNIHGINKNIRADFVKAAPDFKFKKSKDEEYFDFRKLEKPLFVRFKKSEDRIRPLGMARHKRIKRLFIDEKVPAEKRPTVPLVCSGDRIIWACGVKRSDLGRIDADTKKILRLRFG